MAIRYLVHQFPSVACQGAATLWLPIGIHLTFYTSMTTSLVAVFRVILDTTFHKKLRLRALHFDMANLTENDPCNST